MKKVIIEWFRYEREGNTCCRCGDSTEIVRSVVDEFKTLHPDLDVELKEYALREDGIDLSNTVRVNGTDIMDILGEKGRVLTDCPSCTELIGIETLCNSYSYKGGVYDSLPREMLMEAIYKDVYGDEPATRPKD